MSIPRVDRDLLIIAGDLDIGKKPIDFIKEQLKISPVIYILGNHEFYHQDYDEIMDFWKKIEISNFYFLENSTIELSSIRFLGAILWTDLNKRNKKDIEAAKIGLNDFRMIRKDTRKFTPEDSIILHNQSIKWLKAELKKEYKGKTVIITHHLPSYLSVHKKFEKSPITPCFYSDLNYIIKKNKIKLWIHGHTHESFDYLLNNTRIICNPRGYCNFEENQKFKPALIVEI
jgi:Icc-related predicted phosphoesterase